MPQHKRKIKNKGAIKRNGISQKLVNAMCAQSDPFCPHAIGAKIPDGEGRNTLTFHHRSIFLMSPNATGVQYLTANPCGGFGTDKHYEHANGVVSTHNYPATSSFSGSIGTQSAIFSSTRLVRAGIRATRAQADDAPNGYLEISEVPNSSDILDITEHSPTDFTHDAIATTLGSSTDSVTYIFDCSDSKWSTDADNNEYVPTVVFKAVSGDTSTNSGSYWIEYVIYYEAEVDFGVTISTSIVGQTIPLDRPLMSWRKSANSAGAYLTGDPSFRIEDKAKKFGKKLMALGAGATAAYFGGPNAGVITYNGTSYLMDDVPEYD